VVLDLFLDAILLGVLSSGAYVPDISYIKSNKNLLYTTPSEGGGFLVFRTLDLQSEKKQ
jgi:hypothetical protein